EGPRKVTSSPRSTARAIVSSAVKRPKVLRMPSSLKNGRARGVEIAAADITRASAYFGSVEARRPAEKSAPRPGRACSVRLFRLRLAVVALGPLGEDLVPIL